MSASTFPSPIGGVPFDIDFIPSIIFAALYAVASIGSFYRLIRSASRTIATVGAVIFAVERVVIFALRAKQAHTPSEDNSHGLTQYWQMSFAIGYLSIFADLLVVMRALFVKTTMGTSGYQTSLLSEEDSVAAPSGYNSIEDQPAARAVYRRVFGIGKLAVLVPIIIGAIAGLLYVPGETNASKGNLVQTLRYATAIIAFLMILAAQSLALWGYITIPNIRKSSALVSLVIATLLNITSTYRLIVMRHRTTELTSTAPGSLNTHTEKVMFYVFHAAPDLIAALILLTINVRERFSTGMFGDRGKDGKTAQTSEKV